MAVAYYSRTDILLEELIDEIRKLRRALLVMTAVIEHLTPEGVIVKDDYVKRRIEEYEEVIK